MEEFEVSRDLFEDDDFQDRDFDELEYTQKILERKQKKQRKRYEDREW